ncbi:MAG TPA: cupredoxin domain-containing protein [Chloroflexota bacterium]
MYARLIPALFGGAMLFLAACGGGGASGAPAGGVPASSPGAASNPSTAAASPSAAAQVVGQKAPGPYAAKGSVTVQSGQAAIEGTDALQWQPNTIMAKAGEKVTLQIKNSGNTAHTILSPALNLNQTDVPIQKTTEVSFSAPSAPGAYQFWCNIPGHAEAGMVGEVIVQ